MIHIGKHLRSFFTAGYEDKAEDIMSKLAVESITAKISDDIMGILPEGNYIARLAIFDKVDSLLGPTYENDILDSVYGEDIRKVYKDPFIIQVIQSCPELILTPLDGILIHIHGRDLKHNRYLNDILVDYIKLGEKAYTVNFYDNPTALSYSSRDILVYELVKYFDVDDIPRLIALTGSRPFSWLWGKIARQFNIHEAE